MTATHTAGPVPLTAHEQAMVKLLETAAQDGWLHAGARAIAAGALRTWDEGHQLGRELFTHPVDADARLACLRWGLLAELSAVGSVPLPELHALGDGTAAGWTVAVDVALRDVVRERPAASRRSRPAPHLRGWEHAAAALADGAAVSAPSLTVVASPAADVKLTLGYGGGEPLTLLEWFELDGHKARTRAPEPERWRALQALAAGLHAVDRLPLAPDVAGPARAVLAEYLVGCLAERHEPRVAIEAVVSALTRVASTGRRAAPPQQPWRWPAAFGLVVTAVERLAGTDGGPLREPVPGTAVQVLGDDGRVLVLGRIVAGPVPEPVRRSRWRGRRGRHQRDHGEPAAHVRARGRVRAIPRSRLRLYRIPLFG